MRGMLCALIVVGMGLGCGGDDSPSCKEAMTHFYAAGCYYLDTTTFQMISREDMTARCEEVLDLAPERCRDRVDDWVSCHEAVPDRATTLSECDCSQQQSAVNSCR